MVLEQPCGSEEIHLSLNIRIATPFLIVLSTTSHMWKTAAYATDTMIRKKKKKTDRRRAPKMPDVALDSGKEEKKQEGGVSSKPSSVLLQRSIRKQFLNEYWDGAASPHFLVFLDTATFRLSFRRLGNRNSLLGRVTAAATN